MAEMLILCRIVELDNPRLASVCEVKDARQQLCSADNRAAKVLRAPEFLLWIDVARHLVLRNMHQTLPLGHVRGHFGDLRRFAFAAACAGGAAGEGLASVQEDGRVSLPGLGLTFFAGVQHAGRTVRLLTDGQSLIASMNGRKFKVALNDVPPAFRLVSETLGWRAMPRLDWGIYLDDSKELSRPHCANKLSWKIRDLNADDLPRWLSVGRKAFGLLSAVEQQLWIPVRNVLASVVPLQSPPQVNLSGTCDQVLGCICTSLSLNAAIFAETLVHEAAHVTLHILVDETSYWLGRGGSYRSPWRNDPRPISGMVHGIFAFLAVAEFWGALLETSQAKEFESLGRVRLRTATWQVQNAISELQFTPELTEAGKELLVMSASRVELLDKLSRRWSPPAGLSQRVSAARDAKEHNLRRDGRNKKARSGA
jgi:HEXXH motif-containing protein